MKLTRKRMLVFGACAYAMSICVHVFTFFLYHYLTADMKFTREYQTEPQKPFVTGQYANLGTAILAGSLLSFLSAFVFFGRED